MGIYGSGCSIAGGILDGLGIDMGNLEGTFNSTLTDKVVEISYYEDMDSIKVSDRIRRFICGLIWVECDKNTYLKVVDSKEANDLIKNYIKSRNKKPVWGLKDQKMFSFFSVYLKYLKNPYIIFIRRKREDIILTLKRFNHLVTAEDENKVLDNYEEMLDNNIKLCKEKNIKFIEIDVDKDRDKRVKTIANFIDVPVTKKAIDFYKDFL